MRRYLIILTAISLIALWPFFKKGYFESHDGEWMVIRFTAFHQTLASGQFPVRFVDRLNNNYGYPVLNFLYPLPFYLAEIPKLLGFGFVDSIKSIFILSSVFSVVAMFWALSIVFNKKASLTGAILYLFVPYRFVDLYVRGSFGENLAFLFIPLITGSIFKIAKGKKIFIPPLSISIACLILSHNVISILFLPFFIIFSLLVAPKAKLEIFKSFILGVLTAAFFWLPAIYDLKFVKLSQIKVSEIPDHLVTLFRIITPTWGYGPSPNRPDGLSVQVGIVSAFILISCLILVLTKRAKEKVVIFQVLVALVSILLMTKISLPFWQMVPYADVIQFPWRLLAMIVFIQAFLAAYLINISKNKGLVSTLVIIAAVVSTITYTKPQNFVDRGDGYYSTNEDTTTVRDEYLPLWVKEKPPKRAERNFELHGKGEIEHVIPTFTDYRAYITTSEKIEVKFNKIFFPGWQVKINGQTTRIDYQNQSGLITFNLPKGTSEVIIKYGKTPIHLVSEIISLVAIFITGIYFYILWRKRNS